MCLTCTCTCWAADAWERWGRRGVSEIPLAILSRLEALPRGLREHVERSRTVGSRLSGCYGVDAEKVDLAVAAHDLARALNGDELLAEALRLAIEITDEERHAPILLHGHIAAEWMEVGGWVRDEEVLEAVRWHTTGVPGMGPVAKTVFLADKLDPVKIRYTPYLEQVETLARVDMDEAILEFLTRQFESFLRDGKVIHPMGIGLRNELVIRERNNLE